MPRHGLSLMSSSLFLLVCCALPIVQPVWLYAKYTPTVTAYARLICKLASVMIEFSGIKV